MRVVLLLLFALASTATAAPRVILADSDPELVRAVATVLAPWRVEIVSDDAPGDMIEAGDRAIARDARFVVWRASGDLVVYDRESGGVERRQLPIGALDSATAASAALTVKTLMRLPPLEAAEPTAPTPDARSGPELRAQVGIASRFAPETRIGARGAIAAAIRPWGDRPWRLGVTGELGTASGVERSGFKGDWSDWVVLALASWTYEHGPWEIEPHLGGGVLRSTLDGIESSMTRHETATLATARAGVWLRVRAGRWTVGASVGSDVPIGAPSYTKLTGGSAMIFEVPPFAFAVGLFAAADLHR